MLIIFALACVAGGAGCVLSAAQGVSCCAAALRVVGWQRHHPRGAAAGATARSCFAFAPDSRSSSAARRPPAGCSKSWGRSRDPLRRHTTARWRLAGGRRRRRRAPRHGGAAGAKG